MFNRVNIPRSYALTRKIEAWIGFGSIVKKSASHSHRALARWCAEEEIGEPF